MSHATGAFSESKNHGFAESPCFARNDSGIIPRGYSIRGYYTAYQRRYGFPVGDYSDTTVADFNWATHRYGGYYANPRLSGKGAYASLEIVETVTPDLQSLTGYSEVTSTVTGNKWTGSESVSSAVTTHGSGDLTWGGTEGDLSSSMTNGGEGGSAVITYSGTKTGQPVFTLSGGYHGIGTYVDGVAYPPGGSGWSYVGDYDFTFSRVVTYSDDYIHSDFQDDFAALVDAVMAAADLSGGIQYTSSSISQVHYGYDASGAIIDTGLAPRGTAVGGLPGADTAYSINMAFIGRVSTAIDHIVDYDYGFQAERYRYHGDYTIFGEKYTFTGTPADVPNITERTSVLASPDYVEVVMCPTTDEIADFRTQSAQYSFAGSELYSVPSPAWPAPS